MAETSADVVRRYLEGTISAEKNFEAQLQDFAKHGENAAAKSAFGRQALETKKRYERLTQRLESLGGSVSGPRSLLAHVFGLGSKAVGAGHEGGGRTSQNLILAFTAGNSELAICEALAEIAEAAGDPETAALARSIQQEVKAAAEELWRLIPEVALQDYEHLAREAAGDHAKGAVD